jgi:glyoxylase-like metal-dependent hydrolase (beta-lactamase superfamily II)
VISGSHELKVKAVGPHASAGSKGHRDQSFDPMSFNREPARGIGDLTRLILALAILCCGLGLRSASAVEPSIPGKPDAAPADWFHVYKIDPGTYAISEPKYWQQNVSYLILGSRSGVLFDTGPGLYSIQLVVKQLTSLPLLVIPSHLHFDHVGRIKEFSNIALVGLPELRHQVYNGVLDETPEQYMLTGPHAFKVSRWLRDGEVLDLGGRQLTVVNTPGHTPESTTLVDREHQIAFTGDLVNRIVTLCDVPGSDVRQTATSLERLIQTVPEGSVAYEAHAEKPITWGELLTLAHGSRQIADGRIPSTPMCLGGLPMQRFDVGAFVFVLPSSLGTRLHPLSSATETLDWVGEACGASR